MLLASARGLSLPATDPAERKPVERGARADVAHLRQQRRDSGAEMVGEFELGERSATSPAGRVAWPISTRALRPNGVLLVAAGYVWTPAAVAAPTRS